MAIKYFIRRTAGAVEMIDAQGPHALTCQQIKPRRRRPMANHPEKISAQQLIFAANQACGIEIVHATGNAAAVCGDWPADDWVLQVQSNAQGQWTLIKVRLPARVGGTGGKASRNFRFFRDTDARGRRRLIFSKGQFRLAIRVG